MSSRIFFLINILLLATVESQVVANQNNYKVMKNQDIVMTMGESSLISSIYKPSRMQCMGVCSANTNCKTVVYDNSQGRLTNCITYSRYFETCELIPSSTGVIYEKKSNSQSKIYFRHKPTRPLLLNILISVKIDRNKFRLII
jgi:hypothetical protein